MKLILTAFFALLSTALFSKEIQAPVTVEEFVIAESKPGGRLDFDSVLEKKPQTFYLYDGVAYNKTQFAILLWSAAVKANGVKNEKTAADLWERIHQREMTIPERKALTAGWRAELKDL